MKIEDIANMFSQNIRMKIEEIQETMTIVDIYETMEIKKHFEDFL